MSSENCPKRVDPDQEDQNGNLTELERTKKQKDILEALDKISWW